MMCGKRFKTLDDPLKAPGAQSRNLLLSGHGLHCANSRSFSCIALWADAVGTAKRCANILLFVAKSITRLFISSDSDRSFGMHERPRVGFYLPHSSHEAE